MEYKIKEGLTPLGAPEGWVTTGHAVVAETSSYVELRNGSMQLLDWPVGSDWIIANLAKRPLSVRLKEQLTCCDRVWICDNGIDTVGWDDEA